MATISITVTSEGHQLIQIPPQISLYKNRFVHGDEVVKVVDVIPRGKQREIIGFILS